MSKGHSLVLMPPTSPQWAVAECLMWRALIEMLVLEKDRPEGYRAVTMAIGSMAVVIHECSEAARHLGVPIEDGAPIKQANPTTLEQAAERSSKILEALAGVVPGNMALAAMKLGFAAAQMWRQWNAEEAEEGLAEAEREMQAIIDTIKSGGNG